MANRHYRQEMPTKKAPAPPNDSISSAPITGPQNVSEGQADGGSDRVNTPLSKNEHYIPHVRPDIAFSVNQGPDHTRGICQQCGQPIEFDHHTGRQFGHSHVNRYSNGIDAVEKRTTKEVKKSTEPTRGRGDYKE